LPSSSSEEIKSEWETPSESGNVLEKRFNYDAPKPPTGGTPKKVEPPKI